jgi:hypothetical protein
VRSRANRRQMLSDMLEFFDQFLKDKVRTEEPTPTNGNR